MYIARSLAGAIDTLAVTEFDDIDDESIIFIGIDDTILALTNSVTILCGEFLATRRAGIFRRVAVLCRSHFTLAISNNHLRVVHCANS